ncbi:alpha/beta hydrolase [Terrisporobacter sp.]
MKKKIIIFLVVIIAIIGVGSGVWLSKTYEPSKLAQEALISNNQITVKDKDYISFTPRNKKVTKGFIFYPGGGVKPEAYAPICRQIAEKGYEVVIAKMPLNLAIFSPNKADKIIEDFSNIHSWSIGGHSLGGVMASKYASDHKDIKAVALYASYPTNDALKKSDTEVISIYGSKDGVVNRENLYESKKNLPQDTEFIEIDGGNHSQFGDYGLQKGDNKATISEQKQINATVKYTTELLDKVK